MDFNSDPQGNDGFNRSDPLLSGMIPGYACRFFLSGKSNPERGESMIEVSRLNGKKFTLNCEWIETVEATPDTVITLTNGKKYVVAEKVDEVIEKVVEYKNKVFFRVV